MSRVLLGAEWCGPCKRVKKFLDNRGIEYDYVDVDTVVGMELVEKYNIRTVPTMNIDGTVVSGDAKIMEAFSE